MLIFPSTESVVTVVLNNNVTEVVEDTYVNESNSSANYGSVDKLYLRPLNTTAGSGSNHSTYVYEKIDISSIPSGKNITAVYLQNYMVRPSATSWEFEIRHVYNQTWDQDIITWNNHPCGTTFNTSRCNITAEYTQSGSSFSGSNHNWTITNMFKEDYDASNTNFSVLINGTVSGWGGLNDFYVLSKEFDYGAGQNKQVHLFVLYFTNNPYYSNVSHSSPSIYNSDTLSEFNTSWDVTGLGMDTAWIEGNWSGSPINYSMGNATYDSVFNYSVVVQQGSHYWMSCANTTENQWNCTSKTIFSISENTTAEEGGGGAGTGGWDPPTPDCNSYQMQPEVGFSGSAAIGEDILPFTLRIWNGNVSQLFFVNGFTDELPNYCTVVSQPNEKTPVNGYAEIVFQCTAPNGTETGNVVVQTDTGCEDSRPITIGNAIGFLSDTANLLEKLGSGEMWALLGIQTDMGGWKIPTAFIWLIVIVVAVIMILAVL